MLVFGVILMLLMIFLCVRYRKNGFIKIIAFYFFAISLNILIGTVYLSKSVQPVIEFKLDSKIYNMLFNLRMPYYSIIRMFNISVMLYMFVSIIYINFLSKIRIRYIIAMVIPCIYVCITSEPELIARMYVASMESDMWRMFMNLNPYINRIIMMLYMFAPTMVAVIRGLSSHVFIKRRDLMLAGLCSFITNLFVFIFVINGMFKEIIFFRLTGVRVPEITNIQSSVFATISFLWIAVGIVCAMILFFRPFWFYEQTDRWKTGALSKKQNKNISMILHTYKNAFIGISQQFTLAHTNIERGEYKKALNNTNVGKSIAEEHLEMLSRTLNIFRTQDERFKKTDILLCIKRAMQKLALPKSENIKVDLYSELPEIYVFGNEGHLTEMILNLLVNAAESIHKKQPEDARIRISLFCEEELLQISVYDNGIGVEQKNLRRIFRPFFTTKQNATSGIGLSYVSNVIKQHHGYISIKSVPDEYAEFKIVLPIYQGREKYVQ